MLVIVNTGMGNFGSIQNMLKKIGFKAQLTNDSAEIAAAEKIILPGIGSFDSGMRQLHNRGVIEVLNRKVLKEKTPVLGVCLGMQLMARGSEEGAIPGLGWVDAEVLKFDFRDESDLKIPHMGWNTIDVKRPAALFQNSSDEKRFYFVHSYYVSCRHPQDILATTRYGFDFASAIHRENIYGVQFHPEKSHRFGMALFKNFMELT